MASVIVSELGVAPWTFGLGLAAASLGTTLETIGGINENIIDQLFKYQTFLKKCEDAMTAQGLNIFKPIETIINTYTLRYTPTDRNAFKQISMAEFTSVTANWATQFTTLWQRYYEYSPASGGKLYVRLDFGIMGRPAASSGREFYEMSGYRVVVGKAMGSTDIEQVIGQRYFPHISSVPSSNNNHSKVILSTNFYFAASEESVFFSFGGYRLSRQGYLDGRLDSAVQPATLHSGPIFTSFDVFAAEVPQTTEPGVYFPPILSTSMVASPENGLTLANPTSLASSTSGDVTGFMAKILIPSGTFEIANCGVLPSETRTTATAGRVFGMPFSIVISNGILVAKELVLMIDPNILSFDVEFFPFYIAANKKTVMKLPCIAQGTFTTPTTPTVPDLLNANTVSMSSRDSARANGQTVFGVLLDETPVYY